MKRYGSLAYGMLFLALLTACDRGAPPPVKFGESGEGYAAKIDFARLEHDVPLTPRDRRTLMIGGVVLGVLLLGFLVMNVLTGGGGDEEIPTLPPITTGPQGGGGSVSPSPTNGISPIPVNYNTGTFTVTRDNVDLFLSGEG